MRYLDTLLYSRVPRYSRYSKYLHVHHAWHARVRRPACSRAPCDRAVTAIEFRPRSTRRRAVGLSAGTIPKRRARGPDRRPGFPPQPRSGGHLASAPRAGGPKQAITNAVTAPIGTAARGAAGRDAARPMFSYLCRQAGVGVRLTGWVRWRSSVLIRSCRSLRSRCLERGGHACQCRGP